MPTITGLQTFFQKGENIIVNTKTGFSLNTKKYKNKDYQPLFFHSTPKKKRKKIWHWVKNGAGEVATLLHF